MNPSVRIHENLLCATDQQTLYCQWIIVELWIPCAGHSFFCLQTLVSLLIFECCASCRPCLFLPLLSSTEAWQFSQSLRPVLALTTATSLYHCRLKVAPQLQIHTQHQLQPQPCLVLTSALDTSISRPRVDLVLPHQAPATQVMLSPKPSTTLDNSSIHTEVSRTSEKSFNITFNAVTNAAQMPRTHRARSVLKARSSTCRILMWTWRAHNLSSHSRLFSPHLWA